MNTLYVIWEPTSRGKGKKWKTICWQDRVWSWTHNPEQPSPNVCYSTTLREESSQTNVILQYKLLAAILSAVCSVIQQS